MRKGTFGITKQFPATEIIQFSGPMALIKKGDRQIEIVKINRQMDSYFSTKYGPFEMDGTYEYNMHGQALYIYTGKNIKPIDLKSVLDFQNMIRSGKESVFRKGLQIAYAQMSRVHKDEISLTEARRTIVAEIPPEFTDRNVRFLIDYCKLNVAEINAFNNMQAKSKRLFFDRSRKLRTILPLLVMNLAILSVAAPIVVVPLILYPDIGNQFHLWFYKTVYGKELETYVRPGTENAVTPALNEVVPLVAENPETLEGTSDAITSNVSAVISENVSNAPNVVTNELLNQTIEVTENATHIVTKTTYFNGDIITDIVVKTAGQLIMYLGGLISRVR